MSRMALSSWSLSVCCTVCAVTGAVCQEARLTYLDLARAPDAAWTVSGGVTNALAEVAPRVWSNAVARVEVPSAAEGSRVRVSAPGAAIEFVGLRWSGAVPASAKLLGDTWERSYGDLAWRPLAAARPMPWYFLASDGRVTHGYGVAVQPNALCCWAADKAGISLALDVRAGGVGVRLGGRTLEACTVVSRAGRAGETPFQAGTAFCKLMCPSPRLTKEPVYGFNDWYCAYGVNTGTNFLEDAGFVTSLIPEAKNRPYLVMDDGWQVNPPAKQGVSGFGPWTHSNARFAMDMATFAQRVKALNAKPGLWYRPLCAWAEVPESWRLKKARDYMDPTLPEVKRQIMTDMTRFRTWGFQLVKIDYLTFDMNNRWGYNLGDRVVHDDRAWADSSRTTAEVMLDLYRTMRQGAGDGVVIIGCNALGHLAAGIFELQRTGDDTSGLQWKRTRQNGVNTLAFRAVQDRAFFAVDADCVGLANAGAVPWEKNRQWLDLVARSGTPLFVSWRRQLAGPDERKALREAFLRASQSAPTAEPLDWMETDAPKRWRFGDDVVTYDWDD
ncbi:MAG TPA: alpha-galactosidase [Kiritimatiellia bacterium]|nr:alpha-galactosidase [Kiritimatiellia bacterium]